MSQAAANPEGVPLFACTKCNSRHPFEELSQGHQLCKDCKGSYQVVKCNYCRNEFQQDSGIKAGYICKKCEQLQDQHGKPGPCAYCNIIAAFIGTKCQRCTNSEKKYGSPLSCEHCRQKCAFDRKDPESKKKVDGKLLCWLCTMAYKRTLAKARQNDAMMKPSYYSKHHHRIDSNDDSKSFSSNRHHNANSSSTRKDSGSSSNAQKNTNLSFQQPSHRHSHSNSSHRRNLTSTISSSSNKKQKFDLSSSSSNGHLSSLSEARFTDPNGSDLSMVVSQLKDQVAQLNKRIQMKDKELLSKDQQIADLKSTSTREQRELREKINTIQKQHSDRMSDLQAKLITMQRQIASHNKGPKPTNGTSTYVEPPLVI